MSGGDTLVDVGWIQSVGMLFHPQVFLKKKERISSQCLKIRKSPTDLRFLILLKT